MRFLSNLIASALGTFIALGIVFFLGFFLIFAIALSSDDRPSVEDGSVLVVNLSGSIPEMVPDDPFMRAFADARYDLRDVTGALRMAAEDDRIEAVWLRFKQQQSSWAALDEVREALRHVQESGKPVYASGDDYGLSESDYFLASMADSIFVSPQAPFEWNGFYLAAEFYQGTLEKLNIDPQVVRAGQYKGAVEQFTRQDLSPENELQLSELLEAQNEHFLSSIAEQRGLSADSLQYLAEEAALLQSEDALQAGLLDGLLYPDEVRDVLKARLGLDADDDLRTVSVQHYRRVPPTEVGLRESRTDGDVAIVYAEGTIMSGRSDNNPFGGQAVIGAETFNSAMRDARTNDRVEAVVVRINSPGGSASASDVMWREVRRTAEEKPVIISMGNLAASGGYWLATAGEEIIADPLTITGSIGVFSVLFDASGFFDEKLGITFDMVQTSPYADMFSGLDQLSPQERQQLERSTESIYQTFLERVAENRGRDVSEIEPLAQGRVWSGLDAQRVGLVDEIGGLELAVRRAAERAGLEEGRYRTRILPRPKTFFEQFSESLNAQVSQAWMRLQTSPTERALLEQRRLLQRLADEHGSVQARLPYTLRVE